jgi:hypothetical protein
MNAQLGFAITSNDRDDAMRFVRTDRMRCMTLLAGGLDADHAVRPGIHRLCQHRSACRAMRRPDIDL